MLEKQLFDLLASRGMAPSADRPVILMRHKDKAHQLQRYIGSEALTTYQARQDRQEHAGTLIVSFYGNAVGEGLLLGAWRVKSAVPAAQVAGMAPLNASIEALEERVKGWFHDLEPVDGLDDLRMKLVVEWGGRPNSWRRRLARANDYPVRLRTSPPVPFKSLAECSLIMSELRLASGDIEWQRALGSTHGVYIVTDETTGIHYIGSAYGAGGVWQRWREYASTGHGGATKLTELLAMHPGRELNFRFTLLEVLPSDTADRDVIARESFWKIALGSRTFGLNSN